MATACGGGERMKRMTCKSKLIRDMGNNLGFDVAVEGVDRGGGEGARWLCGAPGTGKTRRGGAYEETAHAAGTGQEKLKGGGEAEELVFRDGDGLVEWDGGLVDVF